MEDLPQEFLVENSSINMEFLESNSWGMLDIYLRNCKRCSANWSWCLTYSQQLYSRPNLGIWFYISILYSHCKNENGDLSSSGTAVLLKFHTLYSQENYIRSIYYNIFPVTSYIQLQFMKVHIVLPMPKMLLNMN